jgi:phosphoribosylformylglycinamidine synthase
MGLGNRLGARLDNLPIDDLFSPRCGSFVLEVDGVIDLQGLDVTQMGEVTDDAAIVARGVTLSLEELLAACEAPLSGVFPLYGPGFAPFSQKAAAVAKPAIRRRAPVARPRVLIPAFPGTNCEDDTARAFERAGALCEILPILNLTASAIEQSVRAFERGVKAAQIIALPGGFSAGDEPEGSAKFIVSFLHHPRLKDAVTDLLKNRDGLMLGLCNGFQALVKLGLVPYGEYRDMAEDAPTLTNNAIGRHVSRIAMTRVASKLSPWYALCEIGDTHATPFSHGEGRFVAPEKELVRLAESGQISTQYVDEAGAPTMDPKHNFNASMWAIEGITSPDGRVLGRMGHPERAVTPGVLINVPGDKDDKIF